MTAGTTAGHSATDPRDPADLFKTQERLRQRPQMEAIGRLAGGIAHDFNNQLHGVSGFTTLVGRDPGLGASSREDLQEIAKATERMAGLTRQLLAFSGQQVLVLETLDLNAAMDDARSLLQRLIGPNVEMIVELLPKPMWVLADRTQLLHSSPPRMWVRVPGSALPRCMAL